MRTESTLRKLLGFSQTEMAGMLNVPRSTYSMFELGKRDLPLESKHILANILAHFQAAEAERKNSDNGTITKKVQDEVIKELENEITVKRYKLHFQIEAAIRKQSAAVKKIQALEYTKISKKEFSDYDQVMHDHQIWKAKCSDEETSVLLFVLNVKLKLLNAETEFLKAKVFH